MIDANRVRRLLSELTEAVGTDADPGPAVLEAEFAGRDTVTGDYTVRRLECDAGRTPEEWVRAVAETASAVGAEMADRDAAVGPVPVTVRVRRGSKSAELGTLRLRRRWLFDPEPALASEIATAWTRLSAGEGGE